VNPILEKALVAAHNGDPAALAEFGFERHTLKGPGIPGDGNEWEERMTITGAGTLSLHTNRSIGDISSEPIGEYRRQAQHDTVARTIQLVRDARLETLPPFRIEPADPRIRISVAAGGIVQRVAIGLGDPAALMPLTPLLQELDRMAASVRADPVRTLSIGLDMPLSARAAKNRLPVTLLFENQGSEGYWITHPSALQGAHRWERCALIYGRRPDPVPGFTPPPIERQEAALETAQTESLDLLWIPRASEVEYRFTCVLEPAAPGLYLARAVYSTYAGEDHLSGRPRLRGCAFSNQVEIEVE
jgi:hypothetical protein